MVGETGFEPATPCTQNRCATRLRHSPTRASPRRCIWEKQRVFHASFCRRSNSALFLAWEEKWWARRDSNPRPSRYERPALTN